MSVRSLERELAISWPAADAGPLPPRPDLSGAKLRLFEAALELFGARGYDAVSVRDVMDALGLKPGALYGHVTSKQELLFELVRIGYEEHYEWLRRALISAGNDPIDQVRSLTRTHVGVHLAYPALARVTTRELRCLNDHELTLIKQVRLGSEKMILDVVERGIRLGEFAPVDPELALRAIAAMGVRAAEWWTPDSQISADEVIETYAEFAVKMLVPSSV